MAAPEPIRLGATTVAPGTAAEVLLPTAEAYTTEPLHLPVTVVHGARPGPSLFLTAAVHGDELNGVAVIRDFLLDHDLEDLAVRLAGTLYAVPVVNVPGFLAQTRTVPDRRDLNRVFPGSADGSFASRLAHVVHTNVISRCQYGLDLHTAGAERSNYPQIRADLSRPEVADLARAFGTGLVIDGRGPVGALRRAAVEAGAATLVYEAGGPRVFERPYIDVGLRGVHNVLHHLDMLPGEPEAPRLQLQIERTTWLRAHVGGMIDLKVRLGEPVEKGQLVSINTNPFGRERSHLAAPFPGIVLGLSRLPLVHPGDAVCHLARVRRSELERWRAVWSASLPSPNPGSTPPQEPPP